MADPAAAILAAVSFWRGPALRPAVVRYLAPFNLGVSVGHIRDAVEVGNHSANTFGIPLVVTVIQMELLPLPATAARRGRPRPVRAWAIGGPAAGAWTSVKSRLKWSCNLLKSLNRTERPSSDACWGLDLPAPSDSPPPPDPRRLGPERSRA